MKNNIFTSFLSHLKIKYTNTFSDTLFNEHPDNNNMFGLSSMLSDYGIRNAGIKFTDKNEIKSLEFPFIAHFDDGLVIVEKFTDTTIQFMRSGKRMRMPMDEFYEKWTGRVLIAEPDDTSIEPNYQKHLQKELFYKFRKVFFLILLLLSHSNIVDAQIILVGEKTRNMVARLGETVKIDHAFAECIYEYTVIDTELEKTEAYIDILQLGNEGSKYFAYPNFRVDSVLYKRANQNITVGEFNEIYNNYLAYTSAPYTVFKKYTDNEIQYFDRVFIDNFIYSDSIIFKWKLSNNTDTICGYLCRIAETTFRGRGWTAYYAEEIPVSDGPWKFSGLPGLILRIEDTDKEHSFSAISVRKADNRIYLEKNDNFKTTRERFNKQLKDYKSDASKIISGSQLAGVDIKTGKELSIPKRKQFYNPIELE